MKSCQRTLLSLVAALLGVVGCNQGPYSYVPASGTVTYEDGSPISAASIQLVFRSTAPPIDEKTKPRLGKAGVNTADGSFGAVTSYKPRDGLIPGEHRVTVIAYDDQGRPSKAVPPECSDGAKTPLVVHTDDRPFDIRIPKP